MNLHEYQAKELLVKHGVAVPYGIAVDTIEAAVEAAKRVTEVTGSTDFIVKAQIHAGGRGKGGGIKPAFSLEEVRERAEKILGMQLITPQTSAEGKKVNKLFIAKDIYYKGPNPIKEYYVSILLNRKTAQNIVMYSTEGGMEIEVTAEKTPELIFTEEIDPIIGLTDAQYSNIAKNLKLEGDIAKQMIEIIKGLYKTYISIDAALIEINPITKTADDILYVADAKVRLDDNALFRHPELKELRDLTEEDPTEVEASSHKLNYVKLDGNVGCMVNGAGLAMATMDIIKLAGGDPANFLDVGGTANAERVEKAFRIILKDKNVKAILVNIFGGIVRCDRVAQGICDAYKNIGNIPVPIIVRLQGTNAVEAKKLIDESGLKVQSAIELKEVAELVTMAVK